MRLLSGRRYLCDLLAVRPLSVRRYLCDPVSRAAGVRAAAGRAATPSQSGPGLRFRGSLVPISMGRSCHGVCCDPKVETSHPDISIYIR